MSLRPNLERQAVDFFAHLIYGAIRSSGHHIGPEADQERFEDVAQKVERLDARLGQGTVERLYGLPWTEALQAGNDDNGFFRGAFFDRSLFFLEESLGPTSDRVSLSAAGVGAVIAGRMHIGNSRESQGRISLGQLQRSDVSWAPDNTMTRLTAGLTEVTAKFNFGRAEELNLFYHQDLPNPKYVMMEVEIDPDLISGDGNISSEDLTVIRPIGATVAWVDQLTTEALATPESEGRNTEIGPDF